MRDVLRTLSSGCQLLGRGADGQVEPREGGLGGKGSAAVAAGHLVSADPATAGFRRGGGLATPVIENLVYEKFSKEE